MREKRAGGKQTESQDTQTIGADTGAIVQVGETREAAIEKDANGNAHSSGGDYRRGNFRIPFHGQHGGGNSH